MNIPPRFRSLLAAPLLLAGGCGNETSPSVPATASPLALAKAKNCMACHAIDKKVVGPAFLEVARKYAGQADAEALLIAKVKSGGKGAWGEIPMPPNSPAVKDEDIKALVQWILAGAV